MGWDVKGDDEPMELFTQESFEEESE